MKNDLRGDLDSARDVDWMSVEGLGMGPARALGPLSAALCALFGAFALFNAVDLPSAVAIPVVCHDLVLVCFFGALRWAQRGRGWVRDRWAHPVGALAALLVHSNILLTSYLLETLFYANYVNMVVVGVGALMTSPRWVAATLALISVGWWMVAWPNATGTEFVHLCFLLLTGIAVSVVLHVVRRRTYADFLQLRRLERERERTLATALHDSERTRDELDARVEARTRELREANERLLQSAAERARAEEQVRASEHRFRRVVEHISDAIIVDDVDGRLVFANDQFLRLFGIRREELHDLTLEDYVAPTWRDKLRDRHDRRVAGEDVESDFEYQGMRRDGELRWISVSVVRVRDESGAVVGTQSALRDITDRKKAEAENRLLEERLRQAQRMESIGRLAGGIAHDFNNLLLVIVGYLEIIGPQLGPDHVAQEGIREAHAATRRAVELTRQLLAFGRRQVLEARVLDLNQVVKGVEKMLRRLLGADIVITIDPDPGLWPIKADPGQVEQVLMNLVVNARDAMPIGGTLVIATANVELDEAFAAAQGIPPGPYVRLRISDTGTGMDTATKERIFEPFFTTKELGKGTGLGLSTVFGIVVQSGGAVRVESEVGHGTTFDVYLPRSTGAPVSRTPKEAALRQDAAPDRSTIVLVEDDSAVRSLVRRVLELDGHEVIEASNGEEALRAFSVAENVDLLLTDVVMPTMSGPMLADTVKVRHAAVKVLFMSGYTDDKVLRYGVLDSGVDFIQKPFSPDALRDRVRTILRRPSP